MFQHLIKQKLMDQSRNLNNEFTLTIDVSMYLPTQTQKKGSLYLS